MDIYGNKFDDKTIGVTSVTLPIGTLLNCDIRDWSSYDWDRKTIGVMIITLPLYDLYLNYNDRDW